MSAIRRVLREEMGGFLLRLSLANLLVSGVPRGGGGRIRSWIYRVIGGLAIGRGTVIMGAMKLHGGAGASRRLQIGAYGFINEGVEFDLGGTIKIGEGVSLGMGCLFLTVSHAVGDAGFRAGLREIRPVTIGRGAWLGARVMVLPAVKCTSQARRSTRGCRLQRAESWTWWPIQELPPPAVPRSGAKGTPR
ncbi:MAG: acyltransferase [bacterium]